MKATTRRGRGLLSMAAACLVAVVSGLVAASPAAAEETESFGFLHLDRPSQPIGQAYQPPNQDSSSGPFATVVRTGVGRYEATFPAIFATATGIATVTADAGGVSCQLRGLYDFQQDVRIGVECRVANSLQFFDSPFYLVFSVSTPPAVGQLSGTYAYAFADEPYNPQPYNPSWVRFTSGGADPQVIRLGTGRFSVRLFSGPPGSDGGNVQVSSQFSTTKCTVPGWSGTPQGVVATVECRTASGEPTNDVFFELTYANQRSIIGVPFDRFAYLRTDTPSTGPYWFNSQGAVPTVTPIGVFGGEFLVTIPGAVAGRPFTVQVTAVAPVTASCTSRGWSISGGAARGVVDCRGPNNFVAPADFSLSFLQR